MEYETVVSRRIRNRIIECLDWIIECEFAPPDIGLNELVNIWDDWTQKPFDERGYPPPTYTPSEIDQIMSVDSAMTAFCDATPDSIVDDHQAQRLPEWHRLVDAARSAYGMMMLRGKLPED